MKELLFEIIQTQNEESLSDYLVEQLTQTNSDQYFEDLYEVYQQVSESEVQENCPDANLSFWKSLGEILEYQTSNRCQLCNKYTGFGDSCSADLEKAKATIQTMTIDTSKEEIDRYVRKMIQKEESIKEDMITQPEVLMCEYSDILIDYYRSILKKENVGLLKWNGSPIVLANLFYQLKNELTNEDGEPFIECSDKDLILFLQRNFDVFEDTKTNTIANYIRKGKHRKEPKGKKLMFDEKKFEFSS